MKTILGILLIFVFPYALFAAPAVSGVSGTITHGQSITVSGTGFGTKSVAAPSLYDKVEGTYTTTVTDGGVVPVRTSFGGGPQEANAPFQYNADGHNHVRFETASGEQRNTHSSACYKTDGTGGAWLSNAEAAPILGGSVAFSYLSWWFKSDSTWSATPSQKVLRIRDYNYDDAANHTFTWQTSQNYVWSPSTTPCCGDDSCGCHTHNGIPWSSGWHFMEGIFDNTNGTYTLRVDNVDVATAVSFTAPFNFNTIQCIGWDTERDNTNVDFDVWWDEIYFDGSASRVMIGNASTYAACTHLEMQSPSSWNANGQSITVSLNQGSFSDSSTAYVYVFDSTNTPNSSGYEITFGDTEDPAPAPPTLSNVTASGVNF